LSREKLREDTFYRQPTNPSNRNLKTRVLAFSSCSYQSSHLHNDETTPDPAEINFVSFQYHNLVLLKMAGGEGAKERRRLKRLAETGGASAATEKKTPDAKASGPPPKRDDRGPPKRDNKGPPARDSRGPPNRENKGFSKDGWKDKKLDDKPKRFSGSPKDNWKDKKFEKKPFNKKGGTPTRKASTKSKKPKHLKRKLDQVAEDEEAKQKVLRDLKEFETKKEELSQRSKRPKNNSYEKKTEDVSMSGATEGQNEPTLVAETEVHPVEEDFVRSTRTTKAGEESVSEKDSAIPAAMDESDDESKDEEGVEEKDSDDNEAESVSEKDSATPAAIDKSDDESKDEEAVEEKDSDNDEAEDESVAKVKDDDKNDAKEDSSNDNDSSDSDDSDSEDEGEEGRRQRGKRRKGRKDTAALIQETEKEVEAKKKAAAKSAEKEDGEKKGDPNKKTLRKDDKRRCIGRNPVTSFNLGEKYTAKVVYIKPFGVFFDIGCHSDAFCHVSRLQDDYIKNPTDMFKEGDEVSARVVEIDRRAKRITVSLQSDARAEDERASIEARQKRKEIIKNKMKKREEEAGDSKEAPAAAKIVIKAPPSNTKAPRPRAPTNFTHAPRPKAPTSTMPPQQKDESQMTHAELKRARKLARRASRRDEQGEEAPQ
jgi:predicted RNA-binding protein with RPS1 domain